MNEYPIISYREASKALNILKKAQTILEGEEYICHAIQKAGWGNNLTFALRQWVLINIDHEATMDNYLRNIKVLPDKYEPYFLELLVLSWRNYLLQKLIDYVQGHLSNNLHGDLKLRCIDWMPKKLDSRGMPGENQ